MNPGIQGFALCLAILAAAPAARAADPGHETAAGAAEAACKKAVDTEAADVKQARYIGCMTDALAFDPGRYFRTADDTDNIDAPGGIVDARHSGGRGAGSSWSFAIDMSCPGSVAFPSPCKDAERLVMRVVNLRRLSAFPPRPSDATTAAIKAYLDALLEWREADLRTCPSAARTLLSLEHARWFTFDDWDRANIVGEDGEIIVPGDGPGTVVRARGFSGNFVSQDWSDEGAASAWAKRMMEVAAPCLRPSAAAAPWDRP